eukprot:3151881-Lingulodinium_polyedra.AAC.1
MLKAQISRVRDDDVASSGGPEETVVLSLRVGAACRSVGPPTTSIARPMIQSGSKIRARPRGLAP